MRVLKTAMLASLVSSAVCAQFGGAATPAEQTPEKPGITYFSKDAVGRAMKRLAQAKAFEWGQAGDYPFVNLTPPRRLFGLTSSTCAVPLLEAPVPKDAHFKMPEVRPAEPVAPMPEANLPAPPCLAGSR